MSFKTARKISLIIFILGLIFFVTPLVNLVSVFGNSFFVISGGWLFISWLALIVFAAFLSTRLKERADKDGT